MFKDEINEILLPQIEIPKLKGHTKIELTDVHTGKKEVIEHDNMITTGLQSYFRTLGVANNTIFTIDGVRLAPTWKTVLGGIYLFDTALPTDAKYMPAGTAMIANGYLNGTNAANPTELGTYNQIESHSSQNEIVLVYDWNTSQGNGTIAAVSLGTITGGYIGYGNGTSKTALSTKKALGDQQQVKENWYNRQNVFNWFGVNVYADNHVYMTKALNVASGSNTVEIDKYNYSVKKIDIFSSSNEEATSEILETITLTLPDTLTEEYRFVSAGKLDNCILLVPYSQIAANSAKKIYILDVVNKTVTAYTFTNNTGAAIHAEYGIKFFLLDDTYALVITGNYNGTAYKVNYTNSAVIGEATKNGVSFLTSERIMLPDVAITDSLFVIANTTYLYDMNKNEFLPTNGTLASTGRNTNGMWKYCNADDFLMKQYETSSKWAVAAAIKNPLRLMTINNLDTPVEKTASKTMKVTYTITRATT